MSSLLYAVQADSLSIHACVQHKIELHATPWLVQHGILTSMSTQHLKTYSITVRHLLPSLQIAFVSETSK